MSGPSFLDDIWTEGPRQGPYHRLPKARRDAINREADRIFAERTGVTRKLDPERDRALCRIWIRLRDAVMAGTVETTVRSFIKIDGFDGSSKDPWHRGWSDLVRYQFGPERGLQMISLDLDPKTSGDAVAIFWRHLSGGRHLDRIQIRQSAPRLVFTVTLHQVLVHTIQDFGAFVRIALIPLRVEFDHQ